MSQRASVVVVGAGIAGITAAYFEAAKGHRVTLVDTAPRPGGLLRSDATPYGHFDYGTHIATWCGVPALDEFLFGGMEERDFHFFNPGQGGNYFAGSLSELSPFVDVRSLAGPLLQQAEAELLETVDTGFENLESAMIGRFGATIYREIFAGVVQKLMGCDAAQLAPETLYFFDMNRVLAFDSERTDQLKTEDRYNHALGFHYAHPGMQKVYPRVGGIGSWIEFLLRKLDDAGVVFQPGIAIDAVELAGDKVTALGLGEETLAVDRLVWSVPAAMFSRLVDFSNAFPAPRFRHSALYDFAFQRPLNSECYFINVYDPAYLAGRLTLYQNLCPENEYYRCTVEVLEADDFDFSSAGSRILEELTAMGIADAGNPCVYQGTRSVERGFPLPELGFTADSIAQGRAIDAAFANVDFVGRAPGRFFMKDVLTHSYQVTASAG